MPRATDAMLARYAGDLATQQNFMDGIVEAAQKDSRDLTEQEMELVTRAQTRIGELGKLIEPLKEAQRIATESKSKLDEIADFMRERVDEQPREVQYRSAGEYSIDMWRAGLGDQQAKQRLDTFNRAAAHQTTDRNPGLLPEPILGPVINFIDAARPLVAALGPRQLPAGNWSRPRVTQHTQVGQQTGEKTELASRQMVIGSIPVSAKTFGGYVNVSRQNVDWSQPQVMDIVINDLASQYAVQTEAEACTDFVAAATAGATLPATPTAEEVAAAFWGAAGLVYGGVLGAGRVFAVCSPDMLGAIGPGFAPVNPTNAQGTGFSAAGAAAGQAGSVSGIQVLVSSGMPAKTMLVLSSAAAEVYEDRIGSLQVVEPSVLGVQVAYAGYFSEIVIEPAGIVKVLGT